MMDQPDDTDPKTLENQARLLRLKAGYARNPVEAVRLCQEADRLDDKAWRMRLGNK